MQQNLFANIHPINLRLLVTLLRLAMILLLLGQAARLAFRPDPRDALRRADRLLAAGYYHDALDAYSQLSAQQGEWGEATLRVGLVRELRGEHDLAAGELYAALAQGLRGARRDLTVLYLGHALLAEGKARQAVALWAQ